MATLVSLSKRIWVLSGCGAEKQSTTVAVDEVSDSARLASVFKHRGDAALRESDVATPGDNYVAAIREYCDAIRCATRTTQLAASSNSSSVSALETLEPLFLPLLDAPLADICDLDANERRGRALALQTLCNAAIPNAVADARAVRCSVLARPTRLGATLFLVTGLATLSFNWWWAHGDLARKGSWRVSSSVADCRPINMGGCAPKQGIFFRTKREKNPWIEYDLGSLSKFTEILVENDRDEPNLDAVPLIVEVSNDQEDWKEIARNTAADFKIWTALLPAVKARYVRFRVPRKSELRLARIEIRK